MPLSDAPLRLNLGSCEDDDPSSSVCAHGFDGAGFIEVEDCVELFGDAR